MFGPAGGTLQAYEDDKSIYISLVSDGDDAIESQQALKMLMLASTADVDVFFWAFSQRIAPELCDVLTQILYVVC